MEFKILRYVLYSPCLSCWIHGSPAVSPVLHAEGLSKTDHHGSKISIHLKTLYRGTWLFNGMRKREEGLPNLYFGMSFLVDRGGNMSVAGLNFLEE